MLNTHRSENRNRPPTPLRCARLRRGLNESERSRGVGFRNERSARHRAIAVQVANVAQLRSMSQFLSISGKRANNNQITSQCFSAHVAGAVFAATVLGLVHALHLRHGHRHLSGTSHWHCGLHDRQTHGSCHEHSEHGHKYVSEKLVHDGLNYSSSNAANK